MTGTLTSTPPPGINPAAGRRELRPAPHRGEEGKGAEGTAAEGDGKEGAGEGQGRPEDSASNPVAEADRDDLPSFPYHDAWDNPIPLQTENIDPVFIPTSFVTTNHIFTKNWAAAERAPATLGWESVTTKAIGPSTPSAQGHPGRKAKRSGRWDKGMGQAEKGGRGEVALWADVFGTPAGGGGAKAGRREPLGGRGGKGENLAKDFGLWSASGEGEADKLFL